jgi:hypothetical protein
MTTIKKYRCLLLGGVFLAWLSSSAWGQIIYGQPPSGNSRFVYTHWTLTDTSDNEVKIGQSYVPLSGYLPLGENMDAQFYIASASNSAKYTGFDAGLSGLGDLRIQLNRAFSEDHFVVSGGVNIPVGKKKLSLSDEWTVMEYLSQDFLSFPMRRLGEGFGFSLLVGGATMLGSLRVGGGAAYQYYGAYKPYDESDDYNPGDVMSLNAGADLQRESMRWSLNGVFTTYTADKQNDAKTFKQSPQFAVGLAGIHDNPGHTFSGDISYLMRGRNVVYDSVETVFSKLKLFGNEFAMGGQALWKMHGGWSLGPSASLRLIAANEGILGAALGSSHIWGLGGSVGKGLGEHADVEVGFRYFGGSADDGNIDISGYQITSSLVATF